MANAETAELAKTIAIEVACALPERQHLLALNVEVGCSAQEAVRRSGIAKLFPDIAVDEAALGVWGVVLKSPETTILRDGDRVEIYRPLLIDPKAARQARANTRANARAIKKKR